MDVVFSEVRQLGGGIEVASEPGKGTAFTIRLPFTATVNRALMVTIGEETYALPLNSIEGIVRAAPDELAALYENDEPSFEYAGSNYELMYVGGLLGRRTVVRRDALSLPVILVRAGQHVAAVHVDSVQGSREIVVKSLGPQFASVDGLSGATVLGDGSVVVILDLPGLLRRRQNGPLPTVEVEEEGERRLCVMVVDDSLTMRKVTSRVLERRGMDVLLAKDGVDAVAMLNEVSGRQPDLMLLDIEMPRMDGFEVARQVRHDDRYDGLPIIMISSRSGRKHRDRARELGVDEFLGKPFQESDLLATIGAVMGQEIGVAHHA